MSIEGLKVQLAAVIITHAHADHFGGAATPAIPTQGHAPNQVMIAGGGVRFVADAGFAPDVLTPSPTENLLTISARLL